MHWNGYHEDHDVRITCQRTAFWKVFLLFFLKNGQPGSITFIGTVSPAGGNLKEPVTENTKKVARCFYALEQERADRKRYPAINPIDSYSKYLDYPEFDKYITDRIDSEWIDKVNELKTRLLRGKEISEQINILGDDGVPVDYHVTFWKSGKSTLHGNCRP